MGQLENRAPEGYDHELKKFLFLDLDGTIRRSKSGAKFIKDVEDVELFPDVLPLLNDYFEKGWILAAVSNQGSVAHGIKTVQQVNDELQKTIALCGDIFTSVQAAFSMPDGSVFPFNNKSLARKPYYGMLANLEMGAWSNGMIIDWDNSIFVGDRDEDRLCAEGAGVLFIHADDFFGRRDLVQDMDEFIKQYPYTLNEAIPAQPPFECLTHENFWNQAKKDYPEAVDVFCKWIDVWKEKNSWTYSKFHELPLAVQLGILGEFSHQYDGGWYDTTPFFLFGTLDTSIKLLKIFFSGLNANILKHKDDSSV